MPHTADVAALRCIKQHKKIPTENLLKMAEFVLKNNYFEFNEGTEQQLSGTAIDTKFAPPYSCIFMDKLETNFFETQTLRLLVCFRSLDVFFLSTHGEENLKRFLNNLSNCDPNINLIYQYSEKEMLFLDLKVGIKNGNITTVFI